MSPTPCLGKQLCYHVGLCRDILSVCRSCVRASVCLCVNFYFNIVCGLNIARSYWNIASGLISMRRRSMSNIVKIWPRLVKLSPFFDLESDFLAFVNTFCVSKYFLILLLLCMQLTIDELQNKFEYRQNPATFVIPPFRHRIWPFDIH